MEETVESAAVISADDFTEDGYLSDPLETDDAEDIIVSTTPGGASRSGYKRKERYGLVNSATTSYDESTAKQNAKMNEELKAYR